MRILSFICTLYIITNSLSVAWAVKPYVPVHPDPVLEPWRWRSFPELKGLGVRCIAEDANGHMWFGTKDGVWMYNGIAWKSFGKSEGLDGLPVVAISVSDRGTIYAATIRGVFTHQTEAWHRVFPEHDNLHWYINDMVVEPDENIWVGSVWGLVHLHENTTTFYTLNAIKRDFEALFPNIQYSVLPNDSMLTQAVAYQGVGIQRINTTISWVIAGSPADSAGLKIGDRISNTRELPTENGIVRAQLTLERNGQAPRTITLIKRAGRGELKEFEIHDVHPTQDGHLWLSLSTGHVARLKRPSDQWRIFTANDNLVISRPSRVAEMQNGNIWVVSDDRTHGIRKFDGQTWSSLKLSDSGGMDVNPSILQTTDGTIWVGGVEGYLHAFRNGKWNIYQTPVLPLPATRIVGLLEAKDGALWIIGQGSAPIRLDYGSVRWTTFEGLNYACQSINGHLWFLSQNNQIVQFDRKNWICYDVSDGLMDTPTGVLATQSGEIWAVGSDKGTAASSRLKGKSWHLQRYPELSWGIDARAICEAQDGAIWLGAAVDWLPDRGHKGGILKILSGTQVHYTPPDALRYIYGIGQMSDESIWIGSRRGLNVFEQNKWTHVDTLEALGSRIDVVYTPPSGELCARNCRPSGSKPGHSQRARLSVSSGLRGHNQNRPVGYQLWRWSRHLRGRNRSTRQSHCIPGSWHGPPPERQWIC